MEQQAEVLASEARRGDVILVEGIGGLGKLITELDRSPFSHVGIVVGERKMLSCRTSHGAWDWADDDTGGVRDNDFAELWNLERTLHLARTTDWANRDGAVRQMEKWTEVDKHDRSAFSYVKLFAVASGLNAVRNDAKQHPQDARDAMFEATLRVGRRWAYPKIPRRPSFFCAEAVAAAFGHAFSVDEFEPLPTEGLIDLGSDWLTKILDLVDRARAEGASPARWLALGQLVESIAVHDPSFLGTAAKTLKAIIDDARNQQSPPPPGEDDDEITEDTAALPFALVTPRMILNASWVEWVRPIKPNS
jgi:hypothetical protein